MRRLILFRHAKTEARSPQGDDLSRRLVERGCAEARIMGEVLAEAGFDCGLALVSPAVRARQTWAEMAPSFPRARSEIRPALYDATPAEIVGETGQGTGDADTVIVIGHNPGLQELAVELLVDHGGAHGDIERVSAGFPTAAAAAFDIDADGRFQMSGLFFARDHRLGARA